MSRYTHTGAWTTTNDGIGDFVVEYADCVDKRNNHTYAAGAYRVIDFKTGKPVKGKGGTVPFYGETAWMDAARLAGDLHWASQR